jgi:hypothetical protein
VASQRVRGCCRGCGRPSPFAPPSAELLRAGAGNAVHSARQGHWSTRRPSGAPLKDAASARVCNPCARAVSASAQEAEACAAPPIAACRLPGPRRLADLPAQNEDRARPPGGRGCSAATAGGGARFPGRGMRLVCRTFVLSTARSATRCLWWRCPRLPPHGHGFVATPRELLGLSSSPWLPAPPCLSLLPPLDREAKIKEPAADGAGGRGLLSARRRGWQRPQNG